jgi:hypothetical protein
MNTSVLLDKLTMIERSIGVQTNTTLRNLVLDAQDCVLELQRTRAEDLRRNPGFQRKGRFPLRVSPPDFFRPASAL